MEGNVHHKAIKDIADLFHVDLLKLQNTLIADALVVLFWVTQN
jgi:hypothetical protein